MNNQGKRAELIKSEDGSYEMTAKNLVICNKNQNRYETPELNDAFQLHYYGFCNIDNLQPYSNINTLYLNNNTITKIQNLGILKNLVTLNLANNRITKIQGLQNLNQLFIIDLSGNKIQKIENMQTLKKLTTFNISGNLLSEPKSIAQIVHNKALTCLNISNNPLQQQLQLFDYLEQITLLTLYLKDTKFSRGVPSYRKQTICRLKQLTYLDQKPITKDQRMMAQAWKKGGLQAQKQARKLIQQTKQQKNKKIYAQMVQRSNKIQKLRDQLFERLTVNEDLQLINIKQRISRQKGKQNQDQFQLKLLAKKQQQLESYLSYFREDVNYMEVGQRPQVPNNLCQRHQADAIYIYGVRQDQLPKIKQVYYPNETRPLIAKDFQKKQEPRWIQNYDQILQSVCREYVGQSQMIIPVFNLKVHELDSQCQRKARRFKEDQLQNKILKFTKKEAQLQTKRSNEAENDLNELD